MISKIYVTVFFIVFILVLILALIGGFFIEEDEYKKNENNS